MSSPLRHLFDHFHLNICTKKYEQTTPPQLIGSHGRSDLSALKVSVDGPPEHHSQTNTAPSSPNDGFHPQSFSFSTTQDTRPHSPEKDLENSLKAGRSSVLASAKKRLCFASVTASCLPTPSRTRALSFLSLQQLIYTRHRSSISQPPQPSQSPKMDSNTNKRLMHGDEGHRKLQIMEDAGSNAGGYPVS